MLRPKRTAKQYGRYKPVHKDKRLSNKPNDLKVISSGGCWCGKPYNHKWEGSEDGTPHPR